ncbi:hypothetical protein Tco_0399748 [Tanacetum coccineum]
MRMKNEMMIQDQWMDLYKKGDTFKKRALKFELICINGTGLPERKEPADLQNCQLDPIVAGRIKVFDGENMGLKGGVAVVEVVVKWNDGGIGDEVVVKGGRRLSYTFYTFWIAASKLFEKSWS